MQDGAGSGHAVTDYFARGTGRPQQVDRAEAFNHPSDGGGSAFEAQATTGFFWTSRVQPPSAS